MQPDQSQPSPETNSRAKTNWSKVRSMLLTNPKKSAHIQTKQSQSKPKTQSLINTQKNNMYNLFDQKSTEILDLNEALIQTRYYLSSKQVSHTSNNQTIKIVTRTPLPSIQKIVTSTHLSYSQTPISSVIDTTGFWIWQAEEIMAYFIFKSYERTHLINHQKFESIKTQPQFIIEFDKINNVLEIGAGSSGLASLMLNQIFPFQNRSSDQKESNKNQQQAIYKRILITDGKLENIPYLQTNISLNDQNKINYGPFVTSAAQFMLWGTQTNTKYDLILAADCIFFEQFHSQLIKTLNYSMDQNSIALFINPQRGNSMKKFIELAKEEGFLIKVNKFKDNKFMKEEQKVKQLKQFDPQRHLYYFLTLTKTVNRSECS